MQKYFCIYMKINSNPPFTNFAFFMEVLLPSLLVAQVTYWLNRQLVKLIIRKFELDFRRQIYVQAKL